MHGRGLNTTDQRDKKKEEGVGLNRFVAPCESTINLDESSPLPPMAMVWQALTFRRTVLMSSAARI